MKKANKLLAAAVALAAVVSPVAASADTTTTTTAPFSDFDSAQSWAQQAIVQAKDLGLMSGDDKGNFRPLDSITRQEVASVLVRTLKLDTPAVTKSSFSDVKTNDFGITAIEAVRQAGLMIGDDHNNFRPYDKITREEMAIIVVKAANITDVKGKGATLTIADKTQVHSFALDYVAAAMESHLMVGDGTNFAPRANAQRQQIPVLALNLMDNIAKKATNVAFDFAGLDTMVAGKEQTFTIKTTAVNVSQDTAVRYKAVLTDKDNKPVADQDISYEIDANTWGTIKTDANGVVFFGPEAGFKTQDIGLQNGLTTSFKATVANAGDYHLQVSLVEAADETKVVGQAGSTSFTVAQVPAAVAYEFTGFDQFVAGVESPFTIKTIATNVSQDTAVKYEAILKDKDGNPVANQDIQYQVADGTWSTITTDANGVVFFGPQDGFKTEDIGLQNGLSTNFNATVANAGDYTLQLQLVNAADTTQVVGDVGTKTFTVASAEAAPADPTTTADPTTPVDPSAPAGGSTSN